MIKKVLFLSLNLLIISLSASERKPLIRSVPDSANTLATMYVKCEWLGTTEKITDTDSSTTVNLVKATIAYKTGTSVAKLALFSTKRIWCCIPIQSPNELKDNEKIWGVSTNKFVIKKK